MIIAAAQGCRKAFEADKDGDPAPIGHNQNFLNVPYTSLRSVSWPKKISTKPLRQYVVRPQAY
jgi:hypothetical protein